MKRQHPSESHVAPSAGGRAPMRPNARRSRAGARGCLGAALLVAVIALPSAARAAPSDPPTREAPERVIVVAPETSQGAVIARPAGERWSWPIAGGVSVTAPFLAPPHAYGPGHRGVDLASLADGPAAPVRAPSDGVIAFVGTVVDRPLLTIDHGSGWVSTLEPVITDLSAGSLVAGGETIGTIAIGGHTVAGHVHFGVRLDGEYVNPLLLLGGVPRAVLLPCCEESP